MPATTTTYGDLSDYGLGKFQKNLDQLAYACIMDGTHDDTEGSDQYNGVLDLVTLYGAKNPTPGEIAQYDLTSADLAFLSAQTACVVETHPSGAVYVAWFTDGNAAQARFAAIRADYATPEEWDY
jgi:hypothetical protein